MGVEIERRFLVEPRQLPGRLPAGERIAQGFLSFAPVVRVRVVGRAGARPRGLLTVKGRGFRVRAEYEYAIPLADARALLKLAGGYRIVKTRHRLGPWLLDRFLGRHHGLWIAELEMASPRAPLPRPLPAWLRREVTEDPRFTNARLARLTRWKGMPLK